MEEKLEEKRGFKSGTRRATWESALLDAGGEGYN